MNIAVDYEKRSREKARLVILEELTKQPRESLSTEFFQPALHLAAVYQDAAWINQEIEYLRNMGAVTVLDVEEDFKIATITYHGKRHLDREITIAGVQRPKRQGV